MKKKNIFLLGTCRIRNIYCHINKSEIKYNFINYDQDFIGRTYSLIDTYELLKCIITNNKIEVNGCLGFCLGAGVYIGPNSSPTITSCTISRNLAGDFGWGAGIYCKSSDNPTINNCIINRNIVA